MHQLVQVWCTVTPGRNHQKFAAKILLAPVHGRHVELGMAKRQKLSSPPATSKLKEDVVQCKLEELKPYDRNSRTHSDAQVRQIADSIREFGWTTPILADEDGLVLAGHGRLMAAKLLKLKMVPVITMQGLTEKQKRAYVIADNKIAENAGWDEELLVGELEWLDDEGFDLSLTGFDDKELSKLLEEDANSSGNAGGGDESGRLQSIFEILIECKDERHQLELLEKLESEGIECRALVS